MAPASAAAVSVTPPHPGTRAALEALLRQHQLDRTLTTAQPVSGDAGEPDGLPFGLEALDGRLLGGLPRGQVSEVVGPACSGRTTLVWRWMASATANGVPVALVDTLDRFDPASASACGIRLDHLLWVRGQAIARTTGAVDAAWLPGVRAVDGPGTLLERTIDRALKALSLILQSGVCAVAVLDLADVPLPALRRIPYATWLRLQRLIEGSETTCVVLAPEPLARSAGGVTLAVQASADITTPHVQWTGGAERARRLGGLAFDVRVASSRRQMAGRVTVQSEALADLAWAEA